ncbi:MAG: 5'-methylthioadenosine/S-adenosylhomocysteine nucleosidase [Clostridia bacterium]|nr:5'-methylthioadenosine/S-adenosylhomocysteine nucleosidase [Clostridia bacterium]
MKNCKKTIGMVVAMEKEILPLINELGSQVECFDVCGFTIKQFKKNGNDVYLINSGIGEISSSSATAILISVFKCNLIINFGVCGALTKNTGVLETVFVNGVVHYDFDLSPIDDVKVGQYPNYDSAIIKVENEVLTFAMKAYPYLKTVICASADKFLDDASIKQNLNNLYGAEICDMESAGILLVCNKANVPVLMIKAVSDGEGGAEEYNKMVKNAVEAYKAVTLKIIEAF